jgi:hypothetical protein
MVGLYSSRGPADAFEQILYIATGAALAVTTTKFFLIPTAMRLRECLLFKPVKLSWTSITLNKRHSLDVKQIGQISRDQRWKELLFTLTRPNAVVILNDTEFVRDVLRKHQDLWGQWEYSERELPFS